MKLTMHQLCLYVDDDYRENVLKSQAGIESDQELLEELE